MSEDGPGSAMAEVGLKGQDQSVASFEADRRGPLRQLQHFLHEFPTAIPFIVLLVGVVIFSFAAGAKFYAPFNLSLVLQQVTIIAILGIAQTLVILTAGIDLSVGAIMILSSIVMGRLAVVAGVPVEIAFPIGLLTGAVCGLVNGVLVAMVRLPPFIVTLGTWSIYGALVIYVSHSETIRFQDIEAIAPMLQWTGNRFILGHGALITYGSILMIVLAGATWYVLSRTAFGRHIYATGDDPEAARLAGIDTRNTLIGVYTMAGLICALAGWVTIGRIGAVSPLAGQNANLDAITAVVIGGTSLFGGRGAIIGTLFGALIVGVFRNGLALAGLEFAVAGIRSRHLDHPGGDGRSMDPEDFGMSTDQGRATRPVLAAHGLNKRYGRVVALDNAEFELMPGEILGVIGDNGAGKSTLIKALCGAVIPDSGIIELEGVPVHFRSPIEARQAGIETVYQNLALSPALSIADNMFLGREMRKPGLAGRLFRTLDRGAMQRIAREKLSELGLMTIQNINQSVETLSGGQRQGVAVARAATFGSRVIIMDEPTAALGVKESRRVLDLILDVRRRGLPIVLISHNMPHVFEVADRIHIHRLGRRIAVIDPKDYSMSDAVAIMTGAMKPPAGGAAAPNHHYQVGEEVARSP